jgi:hypothetical protein
MVALGTTTATAVTVAEGSVAALEVDVARPGLVRVAAAVALASTDSLVELASTVAVLSRDTSAGGVGLFAPQAARARRSESSENRELRTENRVIVILVVFDAKPGASVDSIGKTRRVLIFYELIALPG